MIDPATIQRLVGRYQAAQGTVKSEQQALVNVKQEIEDTVQAQQIVQHVASQVQQRAHREIATVVSQCLAAVFEDPYGFEIRFEKKRGKTEATLVFTRDGHEYTDPLLELGGGVLDVAALALRLACIMVSRPPQRRLLVLDEPWANVRGTGNKGRTCRLLSALADRFQVQWILNTDTPDYQLGKTITLGESSDGEDLRGVY